MHPALRWSLVGAGALVGLYLVAIAVLLVLQAGHRDEVAPNVVVDGMEVGGLGEAELQARVEERATARGEIPVEVVANGDEVTGDLADLGITHDVETAVDEAWGYGRGWGWSAFREQLEIRRGEWYEVALQQQVDAHTLHAWATDTAEDLTREARSASVELTTDDGDVEVEVTEPRQGRAVDPDELNSVLLERLRGEDAPFDAPFDAPLTVEAPLHDVEPPAVTQTDLDAALADAELATSADVVLEAPPQTDGDDLTFTPADLARILGFETDEGAPEGERLALRADPDSLRAHLGEDGFEPYTTEPVEARIRLVDDEVEIDGGDLGFEPDPDEAATRVAELARSPEGERQDELPGRVLEPELSREDAEDLGIEQEVSSFSTSLVPGQPRNTNLQLAADHLDGSLILPGERFSLNEAIGERTEERGFVENGFIDEDGDLVSVTGGGVSQMGTTFMNAAWFAGIELVEFQPHSLYFQRYPMGREATLAWNVLDVVVHNDSPYGILVASEADEESVEVAFWSSPWAEVETDTSEPYDEEEGEERDGFTVDFRRTITYPDGTSTTETYTHTYDPED